MKKSAKKPSAGLTYRDAGVDIDAGDNLVENIKPFAKRTLRPGVLAEVLAVESASLVRQIDLLVNAGLLERRDDPLDRRARTLHLTPAGTQACERIEAALHGARAAVFDGVSDDDLAV